MTPGGDSIPQPVEIAPLRSSCRDDQNFFLPIGCSGCLRFRSVQGVLLAVVPLAAPGLDFQVLARGKPRGLHTCPKLCTFCLRSPDMSCVGDQTCAFLRIILCPRFTLGYSLVHLGWQFLSSTAWVSWGGGNIHFQSPGVDKRREREGSQTPVDPKLATLHPIS